MKRIHFVSGVVLTAFVGLHLFNHFMSLWGAESHILWMEKLRPIYRNPLAEALLLLAVVLQVITGLRAFFTKRKESRTFFQRLQLGSGLYLAFFFLIHVSAVMAGRFVLDLDTNIYFGVAGLNSFPLNLFFGPYYFLAILSFFAHLSAIHAKKMGRTILGISPKKQASFMLILGFLLAVLLFLGLTGNFRGIPIPEAYQIYG